MASMGPHFFKCGKVRGVPDWVTWPTKLQWGRTFSSAERTAGTTREEKNSQSFNGAALFQVRKAPLE